MMRIGCSLRTHRRIAVDAVTGSLPWINPAAGITAATASGEKRMMTKPITALQNPATIQGKVTANKRSAARSRIPNPPGANASAASHSDPAMVTENRTAKVARLANMLFSAASACIIAGGCARGKRLWLLIRRRAVQTTAYNTSSRQEFQSEIQENGC